MACFRPGLWQCVQGHGTNSETTNNSHNSKHLGGSRAQRHFRRCPAPWRHSSQGRHLGTWKWVGISGAPSLFGLEAGLCEPDWLHRVHWLSAGSVQWCREECGHRGDVLGVSRRGAGVSRRSGGDFSRAGQCPSRVKSSLPCWFRVVMTRCSLCVRPFARQLSIVNSCATNGGVCPLPAAPWQTTWQLNRSTICQVHSCAFSYLPCLRRHPVPLCGRGGTACVALHSPACMCWHGLCCVVMCCDVQPGNTKGFLNATEAARWG